MKEIMAIIRQTALNQTLDVLLEIGVDSVTVHSVNGRGKQAGNVMEAVDPDMRMNVESVSKIDRFPTPASLAGDSTLTRPLLWVPKSLLDIVVSEIPVETVIEAINRVNRTGAKGDGKIFVLPIEDALRIRTGEVGDAAIL